MGWRGADAPLGLPAYPLGQNERRYSFCLRSRKLEAARLTRLVSDEEKIRKLMAKDLEGRKAKLGKEKRKSL